MAQQPNKLPQFVQTPMGMRRVSGLTVMPNQRKTMRRLIKQYENLNGYDVTAVYIDSHRRIPDALDPEIQNGEGGFMIHSIRPTEHKPSVDGIVTNDITQNKSFDVKLQFPQVVPKRIKDFYGQKLSNIRRFEIAGEGCLIFYNIEHGYISNFEQMLKRFRLKGKETIIFTIDNSSVIYGRIYDIDGKEIDYASRCNGISSTVNTDWFWDVKWSSDTDSEEESNSDSEEESNSDCEEMQQLDVAESSKKLPVNRRIFPDFIIVFKPQHLEDGKMKILEEVGLEHGDRIPLNVTIQFPSGREIHVGFNRTEKCLYNIVALLREITKYVGSIIVFSCKGEGKFLVQILNDDYSEIEYDTIRDITKERPLRQDGHNGVGISFLVPVIGKVYESGELIIPDSFYKRFGQMLPKAVSLTLKNGETFNGSYLEYEQRMSSLLELIRLNHLERKDMVLFTYCGAGKFDVVIFDKKKIERIVTDDGANTWMDLDQEEDDDAGCFDFCSNVQDQHQLSDNEEENLEIDNPINNMMNTFTCFMTSSNVDNTSHGVTIPRHITPQNRGWVAGEQVSIRTPTGIWKLGIVFNSSSSPRFSAGWNRFSRDNELRKNQMLVFTFEEEHDGIIFDVRI